MGVLTNERSPSLTPSEVAREESIVVWSAMVSDAASEPASPSPVTAIDASTSTSVLEMGGAFGTLRMLAIWFASAVLTSGAPIGSASMLLSVVCSRAKVSSPDCNERRRLGDEVTTVTTQLPAGASAQSVCCRALAISAAVTPAGNAVVK